MDESLNLTCQVCNNVGFDDGSTDGFFYCLTCGSRAEDIISTAINCGDNDNVTLDTDAIFTSGYRRTKSAKTNPNLSHFSQEHEEPSIPVDFASQINSARKLSYDDYYKEVRKRYLMAVQIMLQMQSRALVDKFKVNKLVPEFAASIWLRYVAKSGVFAEKWAEESICESESQIQRDFNHDFGDQKYNRYGYGPVNILGKPAVIIWYGSLKRRIPLSSSLIISFLACHLAREPIIASDIHDWALSGKLPYFDAFIEIWQKLGPPSPAFPLRAQLLCRPSRNVPLEKMESGAASIAESIGLLLPPVNFHAIASRFLSSLSLPKDAVFPHICRIYEWITPPDLYFSSNPTRLPTTICVMSVIIVAVRCVYKLNGFGLYEENISDLKQESIPGDAAADVIDILATNYDKAREIPESSQDLGKYLKYCDDVVFAGLGPSFDEQGLENAINQLQNFYREQKGRNGGGGEVRVKSDEVKSGGDMISKLKEDMGEKMFNYIPPRKRLRREGYLHYNRKIDDGYMAFVAHADYYMLLCSCARVAKVDVRLMHLGALRLEKRLAWMEKHIDRLLSECAGSKSDNSMELDDEL